MQLDLDALQSAAGIGVAGNFAGHLEQAGEAADFVGIGSGSEEAPKGIFPWFIPGSETFLGTFPLSAGRIALPVSDEPLNLQIEPEVGVLCAITYDDEGLPVSLAPEAITAFNDCSIRRPGAPKISVKKNWGPASKGVARNAFEITDLSPDGPTATFRLASFLRRDEETHAYGIDSPLPAYSYYGAQLLDWIVDRLRRQEGADDTPLEPVGAYLRDAGCPEKALIGIGATRYTEVGETTFLEPGDEAIVIVYDGAKHTPARIEQAVRLHHEDGVAASVLRQVVGVVSAS
ncbi:MAG: hypothetical protein JHC95_10205 [Solirubrobacteraceae bacterium]|nr:hypothetical protein [Solirubrobacteraceae bacterium]